MMMKSLQQTFDEVVKIAKTHKGPSVERETQMCKYRGDVGLKCLIGELIPDDLYTADMEGKACDTGPICEVLEGLGYNTEFCMELQSVHDEAANATFKPSNYRLGPPSEAVWQEALHERLLRVSKLFALTLNW